jgi:microcystin degradation protein MlrC
MVEVTGLARDSWQTFGPSRILLGDCAAVRIGGVQAVLIANRTQALGLDLFTNVGIEPCALKLIVVKSTNHFMATFGPIAKKVIYVESGGPLNRDYRNVPYRRVSRPIWPLDEMTTPQLIY